MDILKFFTAGSVDDGKSTLIGRLLYDTNSILADQLEALQASNRKNDDGTIDLAILTDGLRAEREQGITIDVAYKYFQTEKRKFIIADTPGHIQYTRNMVTGASTAKLAIILIDARKGVVEQTVRHSYLVSLLGVSELAVCINKMDMVDYSETVFREITEAYEALAAKLNLNKVNFIPVSALKGDNIVHRSVHMPWYDGSSLLYFLENVEVTGHLPSVYARMPVQWVIRPQTEDLHDYRGYAGRILSGTFKKGDAVTVMPSGQQSVIDRIEVFDKEPEQALTGMSVTLHLKDQVDISRGDVLVSSARLTQQTRNIAADLCWMDQKQLDNSLTYLLQHNSKITKCKIADIQYKVDINTMNKESADTFHLNDIGRVELKTADELAFDWYDENPANGAAILIDSRTNLTVAALMFREAV
ncbi:sulfate adenylyltransferase subunit 1 [Pedobacter antarcticus]|uniref:sulfate adenylyltransferase subunit 1 n=1 Tax=Pedobacter antarcticus TaxID=34086 RepID=UPI001C5890C4|nr:GTP-binding protein [Pedobacter antarcticus]